MKSGDTYPRNTALAILLGGVPGGGKSNLCMEFNDPWFADADHNLRNAIERHPGKRFYWDDPERDANGAPIDITLSWNRLETLIKENGPKPEVGAIVMDGVGRITDYLKAHLTKVGGAAEKVIQVGGMPVMNQSLWQPYSDLLKRLVFLCRSFNKPFIMTTHLSVEVNELSSVKEQWPLIQGSLKADFPKLFTDFWQCDAVPDSSDKYKAVDKGNGVRYLVRTAPTNRIMLKQSCGLPAVFEPGDEVFRKLIAGLTPALTPPATPA